MPSLGGLAKYVGLFSIGKSFIDKVVLQKLLFGVATILGLAVVVAILAGTVLVSLLALIYYSLISYTSINEVGAAAIVGVIIIALISVIVWKIIAGIKKIASVSSIMIQTSLPTSPLAPVTDIVNAFLAGLKSHEDRQKGKKYPKSVK